MSENLHRMRPALPSLRIGGVRSGAFSQVRRQLGSLRPELQAGTSEAGTYDRSSTRARGSGMTLVFPSPRRLTGVQRQGARLHRRRPSPTSARSRLSSSTSSATARCCRERPSALFLDIEARHVADAARLDTPVTGDPGGVVLVEHRVEERLVRKRDGHSRQCAASTSASSSGLSGATPTSLAAAERPSSRTSASLSPHPPRLSNVHPFPITTITFPSTTHISSPPHPHFMRHACYEGSKGSEQNTACDLRICGCRR